MPGRHCGTDFYHFWHVGSYRRRNHPLQISSRSVKGFGFYRYPNSGVSHWLRSSPFDLRPSIVASSSVTHYRATLWSSQSLCIPSLWSSQSLCIPSLWSSQSLCIPSLWATLQMPFRLSSWITGLFVIISIISGFFSMQPSKSSVVPDVMLLRGAFTCVGWQVTLCDPIWQVTSRGCEMGVPLTAIHWFTLLLFTLYITSGTTDDLFCFRQRRAIDSDSDGGVTGTDAGRCHLSTSATSTQLCPSHEDNERYKQVGNLGVYSANILRIAFTDYRTLHWNFRFILYSMYSLFFCLVVFNLFPVDSVSSPQFLGARQYLLMSNRCVKFNQSFKTLLHKTAQCIGPNTDICKCYAENTTPTPTRRNCRVESRWRR